MQFSFHPDTLPHPRRWSSQQLDRSTLRIEQKLDGWRMVIVCDAAGEVEAWNKRGRRIYHKLSNEMKFLINEVVPPKTVLDGELVRSDGAPASYITSSLSMRKDNLAFYPFSVPWYDGHKPMSWEEQDHFLARSGFDGALERYVSPKVVDLNKLDQVARDLGIEGFVLKERLWSRWWKIKGVKTADLLVVGTKPGKGKHKGRLGALECADATGNIVASVGKGADDEWRDLEPDEVLGRVCEVSHEGVQVLGRLRFSSFVRWRDDKDRSMLEEVR